MDLGEPRFAAAMAYRLPLRAPEGETGPRLGG